MFLMQRNGLENDNEDFPEKSRTYFVKPQQKDF